MSTSHTPDPRLRQLLENNVQADSNLCWTCGSCLNECPVNLATNRLQPLKVVRMATFGFMEDLIRLPEIWYCLTCRRCNQVCPMSVKPAAIIEYVRREAVRRDIVPFETLRRYRDLFARFQRVRYQTALHCRSDWQESASHLQWREWLSTPVETLKTGIAWDDLFSQTQAVKQSAASARTSACFTCGECSSACPVFIERGVFDPVWIFRMANLGLTEELLKSAAIWLCIACQRCTDACSQKVKGHLMIKGLQEMAIQEGFVDRGYPLRLHASAKEIYNLLLDEIDSLFGF